MITQYCIIRNQTVILNGETLHSGNAARLNDFLDDAYAFFEIDYPKFYKMDNLSKLGFLAAEVMLKGNWLNDYPAERIGIVLSNAHSSLDTDIRYLESAKGIASPALFVYTLPNIVAGEICIRHKIKGENAFFITPAFDPDLMADYVSIMMSPRPQSSLPNAQSLMPNACIAGWIDVMNEHHDVFLYLLEKDKPALVDHSPEQLKELYNIALWNN